MIGGWWASSAYETGGVALVAAWVIWVVLSITLHELAHGWVAVKRGDQTPILTGHMTFNPIVHMGVPSLVMLALLGIAWGAMPVDVSRMRGRYAEALMAFAGPAMNFFLAAMCILVGGVFIAFIPQALLQDFIENPFLTSNNSSDVLPKLVVFAGVGAMINLGLGMFNLIPCPPLDGSRILGNFSSAYRNFTMTEGGRVLNFIAMVIAFFFAGRIIIPVGWLITIVGMGGIGVVLKAMGVGV